LITSGELKRLIDEDGLGGVTSNPSIFEKALRGSTDYDDFFADSERHQDQDAMAFYEGLAVRDIQQAADVLRPIYEQTHGRDGYVSLEVSPYLAHDTAGTVAEARRLWMRVARDNLMIKVPATAEGIPAIRQLIGEGINVNITLLFARETYEEVAEAYFSGLESLGARGGDVSRMASVASFFVSRIDTSVDALLNARLSNAPVKAKPKLQGLLGRIAIANAKLAYQTFKGLYDTPRWQALADKGARVQRLLWASTSTKNPQYRDVMYVEELIGPDTVSTMPPATIDAFRDHGRVRPTLEDDLDDAFSAMETLAEVGISMKEVTDKLVDDGVRRFTESMDRLLGAAEKKREGVLGSAFNRMTWELPQRLQESVSRILEGWRADNNVRRLWARDASLWTNADEAQWLDWLGITDDDQSREDTFHEVAQWTKKAGYEHSVLLGMGGSSLCPEVLEMTFGKQQGRPELLVLDSTDPAQIRDVEARIDLTKTLFIVSSKSGSTLEPNILKDYFFARVREAVGPRRAGHRFVAITDPGSPLEHLAEGADFARVFHGVPGIGGRYSALSNFGLLPAAIMGLDVGRLLTSAEIMVHACDFCVAPAENPGVILGAMIGAAARNGRDKVTFIVSPGIVDLGAWLEQLLAESTGKNGKGVIPIDREPIGPPEVYGSDRFFVYLRLDNDPRSDQDAAVEALQQAGHPIARLAIAEPYHLAQEFFRWEIATAVAGSLLGINPFNQPDVEASKAETRKLMTQYEQAGAIPAEPPIFQEGEIQLFADNKNARELAEAAGSDHSLRGLLRAHLKRLRSDNYFALLAYIERNDSYQDRLQAIRRTIRDAQHVATCLGFGPRYLHSTGQVYKGGPNTGVFLQITGDDPQDLPVARHKYTFGMVKAAQARGDFHVLCQRDRRVLRVHLGHNIPAGLTALQQVVEEVLTDKPHEHY
jgi:transaldolase/glucose-6-phosphate isomerase